jgi:glycosyltransferase involved in cell wall biosynthesis
MSTQRKKPYVSVIVPVYNTAAYLDECISSLQTQSLKDIEIIIVNDASSDNSSEVITKLAAADDRIQYISHSVNKMQGGARNTGLHAANSPYVCFVDSDDRAATDMCGILYNAITRHSCDVVTAGYFHVFDDGTCKKSIFSYKQEKVFTGEDFLGRIDKHVYGYRHEQYLVSCHCWNKIYNKDFLVRNAISFPEGIYYQDIPFTYAVGVYAKKAVCIPDCLYYYRSRQGSAVHEADNKRMDDLCTALRMLKELFYNHTFDYFPEHYTKVVYNHLCINQPKRIKKYMPVNMQKFYMMGVYERYLALVKEYAQCIPYSAEDFSTAVHYQKMIRECKKNIFMKLIYKILYTIVRIKMLMVRCLNGKRMNQFKQYTA